MCSSLHVPPTFVVMMIKKYYFSALYIVYFLFSHSDFSSILLTTFGIKMASFDEPRITVSSSEDGAAFTLYYLVRVTKLFALSFVISRACFVFLAYPRKRRGNQTHSCLW
jgi:hypothetical protein